MLRELKVTILGVLTLALAAMSAGAFSLAGPLGAEPSWQVLLIGFQEPGDITTPRNIGDEYRWNTPVLVYAFDSTYSLYYGSNGIAEVDKAFAILNSVTNVSQYSAALTEIPLDTTRLNSRASALNLIDIKSQVLNLMLVQLGLDDAERWMWVLHDRLIPTGATCPTVFYEVVQRNFDPITMTPSSYINGNLYTFQVFEACQQPAGGPVADAVESFVDPFARSTAVAGGFSGIGNFYTGLTRDDVGGLRYLLRTNNILTENVDGELLSGGSTGGSSHQILITTSNLADLVTITATNNPATVASLFPDLIITSSSFSFQVIFATNTISYFTNLPTAPFGSAATLVTSSTVSSNIQQRWTYGFGNVTTNAFRTSGLVTIITTNVSLVPNAPVGTAPTTNITSVTVSQNFINGEYFIIPTNCGFQILNSNFLTQVTPSVSSSTSASTTGATNVLGPIGQTVITYFTNHVMLALITDCVGGTSGSTTNSAVQRQGIERIQFVHGSFDGVTGQTFIPMTNVFTVNAVINNVPVAQTFRRTVNTPDILFLAADLSGIVGNNVLDDSLGARTAPNFSGPLPGPGVIRPTIQITLNKSGPVYENETPFFLSEAGFTLNTRWASYDGTTNAPVIYPDGSSIQNLENQILMKINPSTLPSGTVGVPYSQTLSGQGGQPPYTFSLSASSGGMPPGLTFTGGTSVLIAGTPTTADTYDITIHMVDTNGRAVDVHYAITINP